VSKRTSSLVVIFMLCTAAAYCADSTLEKAKAYAGSKDFFDMLPIKTAMTKTFRQLEDFYAEFQRSAQDLTDEMPNGEQVFLKYTTDLRVKHANLGADIAWWASVQDQAPPDSFVAMSIETTRTCLIFPYLFLREKDIPPTPANPFDKPSPLKDQLKLVADTTGLRWAWSLDAALKALRGVEVDSEENIAVLKSTIPYDKEIDKHIADLRAILAKDKSLRRKTTEIRYSPGAAKRREHLRYLNALLAIRTRMVPATEEITAYDIWRATASFDIYHHYMGFNPATRNRFYEEFEAIYSTGAFDTTYNQLGFVALSAGWSVTLGTFREIHLRLQQVEGAFGDDVARVIAAFQAELPKPERVKDAEEQK